MLLHLFPSIRATLVLAIFTGIVFPVAVTALAQLFFPDKAHGSLVKDGTGRVIGSTLIGQNFSAAKYFHSRPSAAGAGYAGEASGGTNLGPTSRKLIEGVADEPSTNDKNESFAGIKQLAQIYRQENELSAQQKVPVDAVTRSASGLDPHISLLNANYQAARVARVRGLPIAVVEDAVKRATSGRDFGILGEPRVNVLDANLALDKMGD